MRERNAIEDALRDLFKSDQKDFDLRGFNASHLARPLAQALKTPSLSDEQKDILHDVINDWFDE